MTETVVVRCVHGLEAFCAAELAAVVGPEAVRIERREVAVEVASLTPALLALRTADDVFVEVGAVVGGTTKAALPALGEGLTALDWTGALARIAALRDVPAAPVLDVVASLEGRHTYNRFAVEERLGRPLAAQLGGRYLARTAAGREPGEPDVTVRVFVRSGTATAALRLSARPLHRRAYKERTGPGTLHPPVAAALAAVAAPGPGETVLDPFCGDGTIAVETALAYPSAQVTAADLDPDRVANTRANATAAGVALTVRQADAATPAEPAPLLVTNPPWNLAVDAAGRLGTSLAPFWRSAAVTLAPAGRAVLLTEAELGVPQVLAERGWAMGHASRLRVAGRVADLVLAAPPGAPRPALPPALAAWRDRAVAAGVATPSGF